MPNCLTFALQHWRYGNGDHIVIRKSHWGWFPHFKVMYELHDGTVVIKEFRPIDPTKHRFPPLFFRGEIVTTSYRKINETKE